MWMDFFSEYGIFLAKLGTILVFILVLVGSVFMLYTRSKSSLEEHLEVRNLNRKYEQMQLMLKSAMMPRNQFKQAVKELKNRRKKTSKKPDEERTRIFILHFRGDIRASQVNSLREEISALLSVARDRDEVLVVLESGGGTVHGYGLAASQLQRIRDKGVRLTVAVDKVAASGGYMMACVADRIIAAPFAVIGSVGVLAQIPNFHRFLKKHNIDVEQFTAGDYKRTLTLFGENTKEDRERLQQELEETHALFKQFVKEHRGRVDMDQVATGKHWYGQRALEVGLVDELRTSDDYLSSKVEDCDLLELEYVRKKPLLEKLFGTTALFRSEV
jgi:serine protease SohB